MHAAIGAPGDTIRESPLSGSGSLMTENAGAAPGPTLIDGQVRQATPEEKELCRLKMTQGKPIPEDTSDWQDREVWVIEHGGIVSGCLCARQVWQLEPLFLFPEFAAQAPPVTMRRAVFKLVRTVEAWLRTQRACWYFGYIERKPMQRVAREYGMLPVYRKGLMFGKEL